ncbi:hypothetical protein D3C77_725300 [compost metagenome]
MLVGLDALGHGFQSQAVGDAEDGLHDALVAGIVMQIAHERAIDLQAMHGQVLQVAER